VDGALVQMRHPRGFAPPRPIRTPILIAAAGPRGREIARSSGDGVIAMGEPCAAFDWNVYASTGTVLDPGETFDSPRVFESLGAAIALTYHFLYETSPEALAHVPGGPEWRAAIEAVPADRRHLELHEGHGVAPNERELPHLSPLLATATLTGSPSDLEKRLDELRGAGVTELMYTPLGPDIPREMRAMAEVAGVSPR
jgi:5,10-methylenetetrahydromethanopterin reductase